ncbi:cytochrome P450 [Artemisia annua]|uniref:Cytochrome P450 n=1 Tax=Artemisia annua TaxID=35608 RepID=A0A2U1QID5_ARTAN|nr:cytochrome P450 [Artemisia annua]
MALPNSHGSWWWEVITSSTKDELTLAVCVTILLATLWYKIKLSSSSNGAPSLPPGPRSVPILGYLPFLRPDLHKQLTEMSHTYGPIFKFYLGSKLHVVINTPELAKVVLREHDETFANHVLTIASSVITYGGQDILFSKNNANWRHLRKILVYEVLNNKNLEACRNFRKDEVRKTIKNVFSRIGTTVNVNEISFLTTSNVVTKMVWENSTDEGSKDSNLGAELKTVATKCVQIFNQINLSDIFPILAWFDLQGVERDMKEQLTKVDQIFASMIEDRIRYNSVNGVGHEGKKDFLQALLELKDKEDGKSINIYQLKSLLMWQNFSRVLCNADQMYNDF